MITEFPAIINVEELSIDEVEKLIQRTCLESAVKNEKNARILEYLFDIHVDTTTEDIRLAPRDSIIVFESEMPPEISPESLRTAKIKFYKVSVIQIFQIFRF